MDLKPIHIITAVLVFMTAASVRAQAQTGRSFEVGTFHSYKAIGFDIDVVSSADQYDTFQLVADMHQVFSGKRPAPGIRAAYIHNVVLKHFTFDGDVEALLYTGPGLTLGYVRDGAKPFGIMTGITGVLGARFILSHNITICTEIGTDISLFAGRNQRYNNIDLTLYESGLKNIIYPQLKIMYRIR